MGGWGDGVGVGWVVVGCGGVAGGVIRLSF